MEHGFSVIGGYGRRGFVPGLHALSRAGAHVTNVRMSFWYEDRTKLLVSYDELPDVLLCVAEVVPPLGLARITSGHRSWRRTASRRNSTQRHKYSSGPMFLRRH